jgi:hypothetical protein
MTIAYSRDIIEGNTVKKKAFRKVYFSAQVTPKNLLQAQYIREWQ